MSSLECERLAFFSPAGAARTESDEKDLTVSLKPVWLSRPAKRASGTQSIAITAAQSAAAHKKPNLDLIFHPP
jgi:hypothetical protein